MPKKIFRNGNKPLGIVGDQFTAEHGNQINIHRHDGIDEDFHGVLDYYTAGGTANALSISCSPALTEHYPGMPIYIKISATNTGPVTLKVDSLDVRSIKKAGAVDLDPGDLIAGQIVIVAWDGAVYQLLSAYNVRDSYVTSGGSSNAYTLTLPNMPVPIPGRPITFKANFENIGAATLNVNGLGAKGIKKIASDVDAGDIQNGQQVTVMYDGTNFQLLSGYRIFEGFSNMQVFDASGSWTVPAGVTKIRIEVWGGGAGGCGGAPTVTPGWGGGAGGYGMGIFSVTPGASHTVTIGAGGAAGAINAAGGNGGTTSFGSLISATGGTSTNGTGGVSTAPFNITGGGAGNLPTSSVSSRGGNAPRGGSGGDAQGVGQAPGGGGSGGYINMVGFAGAAGRVVVYW